MRPDPRIGVVMPTLDRPGALTRALGALARQTIDSAAFEVVVVADAASTEAPEPGDQPYAVRVIRAQRPGASAARNAGWRATRAALVLFTGDDIVASPRLLAEHLAWHERAPEDEMGVLGLVEWAKSLRRDSFMTWLDAGIQFDYGTIAAIDAGPGQFYTANVSLKRAMLARVGGFDQERFPFLYEDIDLGLRLFEHGFRLLFNRDASAEHVHQPRVEEWRERMRLVASAERRWVERHPGQRAYFHDLFADALARPPARGRGRPLVRLIPRGVPLLGPRVWASNDLYYRQLLADAFMAGWDSAPD